MKGPEGAAEPWCPASLTAAKTPPAISNATPARAPTRDRCAARTAARPAAPARRHREQGLCPTAGDLDDGRPAPRCSSNGVGEILTTAKPSRRASLAIGMANAGLSAANSGRQSPIDGGGALTCWPITTASWDHVGCAPVSK